MSVVDIVFPLVGQAVPCQHGYPLYGAISRIVPAVHESKEIGIFSISGMAAGDGLLALNDSSRLRLRVPESQVRDLLPLAGKSLELDGHKVSVGVPHLMALVPAASLRADVVLIKMAHANGKPITADAFMASARKKLAEMGIAGEAGIPLVLTGQHAGQPQRRIVKVKQQTHVGFSMIVEGLSAEESIKLQEQGLGGRRLMGCGLFVPMRGGAGNHV